jgi:nucleoside-diphosphate-sugar epimerase
LKTVVITGARGYIGSALAEKLANQGHVLRLVSRSLATPPAGSAGVEYCTADLRDPHSWAGLLRGADAVVHLSSRTDLRVAESNPADDNDVNVRPVHALVEAAQTADRPPTVVFASAVTIAGPRPQIPVDEAAPNKPCSVYDRHKLAGEMILGQATARGIVRACSLRLSNVYGYGGVSINANRGIVNLMLSRAVTGEPLTLYGQGAYMRDFIHVDDVVDAFRRAIAAPGVCDGQHYVIASGRSHTLAEAYELIAEVALEQIGCRIEIVRVREPADLHPIERRDFVGDSRAFQERTGWCPQFALRAGIRDYFIRATQPAKAH